jgi:hypothetical protein
MAIDKKLKTKYNNINQFQEAFMAKYDHHSQTRPDWQTHEGYTLVSDVTFQIMDDLDDLKPARIESASMSLTNAVKDKKIRGSTASLYITTAAMTEAIPSANSIRTGNYGVTKEDLTRANRHDTFESGLGDINFSWHFTPALASAVVEQMVDEERLEDDEVEEWKLRDWADVIGTGWFSKLTHSMAYARNGTYGAFGRYPHQYAKGALADLFKANHVIAENTEQLFDIKNATEPETGETYITAMPTKAVRKGLRNGLHQRGNSAGCPAARFGSMIYDHMPDSDPHTKNLISSGHAVLVPERSTETEIMLRQEWSPIDVSLLTLAKKIGQYEELYGTPRVEATVDDYYRFTHLTNASD